MADLGIAKEALSAFHTQGMCTECYAAPELLSGANYNEKVDMWAVGLCFYNLEHVDLWHPWHCKDVIKVRVFVVLFIMINICGRARI